MVKSESEVMIPEEVIINKIFLIQGKKLMLDWDPTGLKKLETIQLKLTARSKISRFPEDLLFELTAEEL
jgi:hypothetical protein